MSRGSCWKFQMWDGRCPSVTRNGIILLSIIFKYFSDGLERVLLSLTTLSVKWSDPPSRGSEDQMDWCSQQSLPRAVLVFAVVCLIAVICWVASPCSCLGLTSACDDSLGPHPAHSPSFWKKKKSFIGTQPELSTFKLFLVSNGRAEWMQQRLFLAAKMC